MAMQFTKATKKQARLRLALIGPSGSGKTYSALNIGQHLGQRVALIDTEHHSASKYANLFNFDTLDLETFSPSVYIEAIHAAEAAGYDVLVIDSLSHAWMGKEGALELVDRAAKRSQSNNTYTAWRDVTPLHNALIDAMLQSPCHVIVTMRAKTEYVLEENERGKKVPRKVGMAPVQRDGMEYEFDVVADMNQDNDFVVSKSRCPAMTGQVINKPGKQVADILRAWLTDGTPQTAGNNGKASQTDVKAETLISEITGDKPTRPYAPEILKAGLTTQAKRLSREFATADQSQALAAALEQILGGKSQRHELTKWLTGKTSVSKDSRDYIGDAWVLALYRWLKPAYSPDAKLYTVDENAKSEATTAHAFGLKENGQGVLLEA